MNLHNTMTPDEEDALNKHLAESASILKIEQLYSGELEITEKSLNQLSQSQAIELRDAINDMNTDKLLIWFNNGLISLEPRITIPELMDRHYAQQRRDGATVRDLCKAMRFAVNALDDGLPKLAQEILGDALRTYGEEQP